MKPTVTPTVPDSVMYEVWGFTQLGWHNEMTTAWPVVEPSQKTAEGEPVSMDRS